MSTRGGHRSLVGSAASGTYAPGSLVTAADGVSKAGLWLPRGPQPMQPPSKVITRFQSGHGWSSPSSGTAANDTSDFLLGAQSWKVTTNGSGGSAYTQSATFSPALDLSKSMFRVFFKVDNPTNLSQIQLYAETTSTDNFVSGVNANADVQAGQWVTWTGSRAHFTTNAGSPDWTSIADLKLRAVDKNSTAINVHYNAVELLPDYSAIYPKGCLVLECDDGYSGQISNLLPMVDALGIPVTFNPIIARVLSGSNTWTADLMRKLQDSHGWQMSVHSYTQAAHDTANGTAADLEADFLEAKQWLHAQGLHAGVDDVALHPGTGTITPTGDTLDVLRRNFRSCRMASGFQDTVVPANPMGVRSILFTGNTVSQLETNIDQTAGAGGLLILAVHDVLGGSTDGTSNSLPAIAVANLKTVLQYAATAGMAFRTRGDLLALR